MRLAAACRVAEAGSPARSEKEKKRKDRSEKSKQRFEFGRFSLTGRFGRLYFYLYFR
ncbi:MAG: hypothetical protein RBT64_02390 [Trichloromonas sp.]|jgi:hypothetical protein|nr:hypothetical protein [Trichloromonas sp.]